MIILFAACLLGCVQAQAQQTASDSIIVHETMKMVDVKTKADSLLQLARRFRTNMDIEPLLVEALRVADKTNYKEIEAPLKDYYGVYMRDHAKYSEAIALHTQALSLAHEQKDTLNQIIALNNLGVVYRRLDESVMALNYHYQALNMAEQINNSYNISIALNSIGNIHIVQQNYRAAINCFIKCLPIAEKANNYLGIAMNLNNIGEAYEYMDLLDSARYYYEKSLIQNQKIDSKKGEAICYNSLGAIAMKEGKIEDAIQLFMKSLDINLLLDDKIYVAENHLNLGRAFVKKMQYSKGEEHLQEGLDIALAIGSKYVARDTYKVLMELHEQTKEFTKAFYESQRHKLYADSIVNEANSKIVLQMETIYATQKKELKIAALEKEKQLYIGWGATGGALFFLLLLFLVVRQRLAVNRIKVEQQQKELAEQRVLQLEQEKQLVATQAVLDGEVQERTRLARDLHDGMGGKLTAMKIYLEKLKQSADFKDVEVEQFGNAMDMLEDSVQEMRRVSHNLMPDTLSRSGLKPAVGDFCHSMSPLIVFNYYGNETRLDLKLEALIYRSIHELVNNALKYAGASQIMVQIVQEVDCIAFAVQDNGCGFDPSAETKGIGLQNIRTRVASFGGDIQIDSKTGEGTEINVSLVFSY